MEVSNWAEQPGLRVLDGGGCGLTLAGGFDMISVPGKVMEPGALF